MRIYGDPKKTQAFLQARRAENRIASALENGPPLRKPDAGTLLKTVQVTDHLTNQTYAIEIKQGDRKNSIEAYRFGKRIECEGSYDGLFRFLRRRWRLRWMTTT